jgi:serine/threonine-protein kinase
VLDVGTLPSGEPYMVMEYLEGIDLGQLVKQKGFLPVTEAVDYILSACEAVAEAHTQGIIHRDLKPSNLYLAKRRDGTNTLKLLDFGIAKIATDTSEYAQSFTTTTALLGSPVYMSPEQLQCSRDADARADIWSLGAIVYRLVSGRPPFAATTMPQLCTLIMTTAPQPLVQLVADIPPGLDAVVLRCLEKNADDRFENVAELARALSPFGTGRSQVSVERAIAIVYSNGDGPPDDRLSGPVLFPPSQPSGPSIVSARDLVGVSSRAASVRELAEEPPGAKTALWAALLVSLVLGFAVGMYWLRGRSAPPPPDEGSFATPPAATVPPPVTAASPPAPAPPPAPPPTQAVAPAAPQPAIPVSSLPTAPNTPTRNSRPRPQPGKPHVEPRIDQITFPAPPPQAPPPAPAPPPQVSPAAPADNSEFGNGRK